MMQIQRFVGSTASTLDDPTERQSLSSSALPAEAASSADGHVAAGDPVVAFVALNGLHSAARQPAAVPISSASAADAPSASGEVESSSDPIMMMMQEEAEKSEETEERAKPAGWLEKFVAP